MKNTMKKVLCSLLVVVLCLTSAPLSGFVGLELPEWNWKASAVDEYKEGYYTYTVSNGEATITDVDTAIEGDISIPSMLGGYSVTTIGDMAFERCDSLTSITIPDSVTTIGDWAFSYCNSLTSVTIPNSVTTIGDYAFYGYYSLISITIPDSVTTIGDWAFSYCNSLTVDADNPAYSSDSRGALFDKNKTILIQYPVGNTNSSYSIPNSVTTIGDYAFYGCYSLTSITIPDSVTTIGDYAFAACHSLTSITIPDSVTTIGDDAFYSCNSLTSVTIPDSVTTIGDDAFYSCNSLTSIVVDADNPAYSSDSRGALFDKNKTILIQYPIGNSNSSYSIPDSVTTIGDRAFYSCDSLTSVTIPDSVTAIGDYAFYYCDSLTSITIPDSVTTIGNYAFRLCRSLTSITIPSTVKEVGSSAFLLSGYYNNKNNWIDGVLCIGHCLVDVNYNVTEVTIPDNITVISEGAFQSTDITSITIPGIIETIPDSAFSCCDSLETVIIEEGVKNIGSSAFISCEKLSTINLPGTIEYIGNSAFYKTAFYNDESNWQNGLLIIGNCMVDIKENVTEVYINDEIKYVDTDIFDGVALVEKITVDDNNLYYSSDEYGVLYNKDKTKLIAYPILLNKIEYTVPDTVNEIELMLSVYLKTLKLPESVEKVNQMYLFILKDAFVENDSIEIGKDMYLCMTEFDFSKPDAEQLYDEYMALVIKDVQEVLTEEEEKRMDEILNEISLDTPMPYGTIHANPGSNAHKYALENGIDFKPLENEEPHTCSFGEWFTETEPTVFSEGVSKRVCECGEFETKPIAKLESASAKDETTKVEITYTEENFESEVEIVVSEEEINANIVFGDEFENYKSFDISLEADGEKIQPKGYVTVKLPIPEGFNADSTVVYYVDDSGNKTKLESTTENGYIVFETDHFSEYVLVDESSRIEPPHVHSYTASITKEATCTENGTTTYICSCGDSYNETIEATGHDFDGSKCKNCDYDKADTCGCNCHKGGFMGFIWKIINFFNKLFKSKQYCTCGAKHW